MHRGWAVRCISALLQCTLRSRGRHSCESRNPGAAGSGACGPWFPARAARVRNDGVGFQTSCVCRSGSPPSRGTRTQRSASRYDLSVRPVRSPPGMLQLPTRWRAGDAGWPRVVWAAVVRQLPVEARNAIIPRPRGRCASAGSRRCFTSWSLEPTAAGPGCSGRSPVTVKGRSLHRSLSLVGCAKLHSEGLHRSITPSLHR